MPNVYIHVSICRCPGNTKVITQSALQIFQEEMGKVMKDPYKVCKLVHDYNMYTCTYMYACVVLTPWQLRSSADIHICTSIVASFRRPSLICVIIVRRFNCAGEGNRGRPGMKDHVRVDLG